MYQITVSFEQEERAPVVLQHVAAGQTLLELALHHHIDLHHDCGGVCACTTCHVYVHKGYGFFAEPEIREQHFMARKVAHVQENSRLSCQCVLLEGAGEIAITIPKTGKRV